MKKYILLLSTTLLLASCSSTEDEIENSENEATIEQVETEEVIQLGAREQADNQVVNQYFSNLSEYPREKGNIFSDATNGKYWLWANGLPVRQEQYVSADGLTYVSYDSEMDQIEVALLLFEGATIQEFILEEELYVSWTYDFNISKLQDLVQVNAVDEEQELIRFTEEDWDDLSTGYKDFLLTITR